MRNFFKIILAYCLWFVDLVLAAWLVFIARTALFAVPALFFHPGTIVYPKRAEVMDTVFTLLLGMGWLAFIIISLEYYQPGAHKGNLIKRFARITGPLVLCIFIVDSILFLLQGIYADNWFRLLIISVELVVGIILVVYSRKNATNKPSKSKYPSLTAKPPNPD